MSPVLTYAWAEAGSVSCRRVHACFVHKTLERTAVKMPDTQRAALRRKGSLSLSCTNVVRTLADHEISVPTTDDATNTHHVRVSVHDREKRVRMCWVEPRRSMFEQLRLYGRDTARHFLQNGLQRRVLSVPQLVRSKRQYPRRAKLFPRKSR